MLCLACRAIEETSNALVPCIGHCYVGLVDEQGRATKSGRMLQRKSSAAPTLLCELLLTKDSVSQKNLTPQELATAYRNEVYTTVNRVSHNVSGMKYLEDYRDELTKQITKQPILTHEMMFYLVSASDTTRMLCHNGGICWRNGKQTGDYLSMIETDKSHKLVCEVVWHFFKEQDKEKNPWGYIMSATKMHEFNSAIDDYTDGDGADDVIVRETQNENWLGSHWVPILVDQGASYVFRTMNDHGGNQWRYLQHNGVARRVTAALCGPPQECTPNMKWKVIPITPQMS